MQLTIQLLKNSNWLKFCTTFIIVSYIINPCFSQHVWNGSISTDWHDVTNWSSSTPSPALPSITDDVVIPNVAVFPVIDATMVAQAKSVTVNSNASLELTISSSLSIDGATNNGLFNDGTITNNGTIDIDNATDSGIDNFGTITNNGIIDINNIGLFGILNGDTITNNGVINIGITGGSLNIVNHCIENSFGTFTNNATGKIEVNNSGQGGIIHGNSVGNSFDNYGEIIVGPDLGWVGLRINAAGVFTNYDCGSIIINERLSINGSNASIVNNGLLILDSPSPHQNDGTFTNNGLLHLKGSGPSITNVINNEVIINESLSNNIATTTDCGINKFNGIFETGPNASLKIDMFSSFNGNIPLGTYDAHLNNFCSTMNLVSGQYIISYKISNCPLQTPLPFFVLDVSAGSSSSEITWTGAVDTNWDDPNNWDLPITPKLCLDVIIPSAPVNQPIINGTTVGYARSVNINPGATLDLMPNSALVVDGALGQGFVNNGTVENEGILYIDNTAATGFTNGENASFTNMGEIKIGEFGSITNFGIFNRGLFQSLSGADIIVKNAMAGALNILDNAATNGNPNAQFDIQLGSTLCTEN